MEEEVLYDLGVDLNSEFTFANGDIALVSYQDNLVQSIVNRLNTELNELDLFYEDYGSIITSFLGWKANDETISFMNSELNKVLNEEPRLTGFEFNINYTGEGNIRIDLTLYPILDVAVDANLVLTPNGVVEIETDDIDIGQDMEDE